MKKEIINYLMFFVSYFIFITIVNSLYSWNYWPLYVGGIVGLFMSNIDHLLHVFVYKPYELTSQRALLLFQNRQYRELINLLYDTRDERKDLVFHTINFQIIFAVLTFWVVSSSGNLFGRGLVLGYFLSLVLYNLRKYTNKEIFFIDTDKTRVYFVGQVLVLFLFGLLL